MSRPSELASVASRIEVTVEVLLGNAKLRRRITLRRWTVGCGMPLGLDLGIKRDRTAAVIAHAEQGENGRRIVLDRLTLWKGWRLRPVRLAEVEEWVAQAADTYRADVILDPWQAVGLAQRLRDRSIRVEEFAFSSQSVGRLASTLHLLLRNRALALPDDEELLDELASVRLRETAPGVLRLDHDPDKHDDQAVALGLCAVRLLGEEGGAVGSIPGPWSSGRAKEPDPTFRDRLGRKHDGSEEHRRWAMKHECPECRRAWLDENPEEDDPQRLVMWR